MSLAPLSAPHTPNSKPTLCHLWRSELLLLHLSWLGASLRGKLAGGGGGGGGGARARTGSSWRGADLVPNKGAIVAARRLERARLHLARLAQSRGPAYHCLSPIEP